MKLHILSTFFILVFFAFYLEGDGASSSNGDGASSSNVVDDDGDDSNCPICMNTISPETFITRCLHKFCEECMNLWLQRKNECPICRTPVYENNGIRFDANDPLRLNTGANFSPSGIRFDANDPLRLNTGANISPSGIRFDANDPLRLNTGANFSPSGFNTSSEDVNMHDLDNISIEDEIMHNLESTDSEDEIMQDVDDGGSPSIVLADFVSYFSLLEMVQKHML
ncbi:E3 ubiquitin-protein ligase Topors-like isoform X25 [Daktulosphaira vitifoliae]|uniref:E3 ubiquitin-protein ligase Topors-like isoform X25 n=1 Tax=Daktulosphaira vitifoliae TaxID=58002 RepID=UPI0021A9DD69|nr:E3 ubiquitin-protein ligase Topors-like isoform X25 [Daktulosphaira vitifoliae]